MLHDQGNGEVDEFEIFRARAKSGGRDMLRQCKSLPPTPLVSVYENGTCSPGINSKARHHSSPRDSFPELDEESDIAQAALLPKQYGPEQFGESSQNHSEVTSFKVGSRSQHLSAAPMCEFPTGSGIQRSHSYKRPGTERRQLESGRDRRKRTNSMPVKRRTTRASSQPDFTLAQDNEEFEVCRVRSFCTTAEGIVNRGDSFKIRRSGSQRRRVGAPPTLGTIPPEQEPPTAENTTQEKSPEEIFLTVPSLGLVPQGADAGAGSAKPTTHQEEENDPEAEETVIYKVMMLGAQGVGKTALAQQLVTSEYLANADVAPTDESGENLVSVQLDDEECMVQLIDCPGDKGLRGVESAHAYVVVYSVTDKKSFKFAQSSLQLVRATFKPPPVAIIVANKQDLVRNRVVSERAGKSLASYHKCKYAEVSAILDHKVDELLVGIIRQIRLSESSHKRPTSSQTEEPVSSQGCLQKAAMVLFGRFYKRRSPKSCDNLLSP